MMDECKVCANADNEYCFACDNGSQFKPMTNADRIRQMSDEELAMFFQRISECESCFLYKNECGREGYPCNQRFFIESCIRVNIDDVMQLFGKVPDEFNFTFLAALKVTHDALLTTLDEHDRQLYDAVINHSETVVIRVPKQQKEET